MLFYGEPSFGPKTDLYEQQPFQNFTMTTGAKRGEKNTLALIGPDGKRTDMTFTVQAGELPRALEVLKQAQADIGHFDIKSSADVVKVSVIGVGMRSHAGVAAKMFKTLSDKGINIHAISTSEIKISVLIDAAYAELAVRSLHTAYGLDSD